MSEGLKQSSSNQVASGKINPVGKRVFDRENGQKNVHRVLGGGEVAYALPLMLALTVLFVWSRDAKFIEAVFIPEESVLKLASSLRNKINGAFATLSYIASGRNVKKFSFVIFGLYILSILGSYYHLLTLFIYSYTADLHRASPS
ncbi:unnamed protein product [Fraxinus pennsylvanica]|uniref:Reticulon domain-containing protein n=1 Tax=Fraxinus pennsylvanica TaxID=56036 RepID=A0AAD2E9S6_9LAMI|nr:unnamed protein product [Fraxinus pennsylvanica]